MEDSQRKPLPFSKESEQSLLGGLMQDNRAWLDVSEQIFAGDFHLPAHQLIFEAIKSLADASQPFDPVLVKEALEQSERLDKAGGIDYLEELYWAVTGSANLLAYAKVVAEHSVRRRLMAAARHIADFAADTSKGSAELLDRAQHEIYEIQQGQERGAGPRIIFSMVNDLYQRIGKEEGLGQGLTTGIPDLDRITDGFKPENLIILAGRPGSGKTTMSLNFVEKIIMQAREDKGAVLFFSMEMSADELLTKLLSSLSRIDSKRLRKDRMRGTEWDDLTSAVNLLRSQALYIDDTGALSSQEIRNRARRVASTTKLDLIVVDYLQLMRSERRHEQRVNEVAEFSGALKALAKELKVPVIALSQLNRALESRTDRKPRMADLRDSGAIEQDADLILFVHHDKVDQDDGGDEFGETQLIIGKHRTGATGAITLEFQRAIGRFVPLERGDYEEAASAVEAQY
ncbi:MAG: replicative DNA helicase [Gammaproteobacteria bacterium]|nr:replicative DNA helicase [Gammaproteobacteria bacterium]MCY4278997.1 replicative DNA helicase [Gammaproteobacteria bacterium]